MRIAVSAPIVEPHPTGVGVYSINLVNELAKLCDDFRLYTSYPEAFEVDSTRVCRVSPLTRPARGLMGFLARTLWMQTFLPLRNIRNHDSVVLSTGTEGSLVPYVPQVITVHDIIPLLFPELHPHYVELIFFRYILPWELRHSAAIIAVSESTKGDIVRVFDLPPEKIRVIYEGYNREVFRPCQDTQPVKRRLGIDQYIHYAGNVLPHKNVARLIEAFSLIAGRIPHQLVIQGRRNSEYYADLEAMIRERGLEQRVVFPGYVPLDLLPGLYSGATVYVSVSLSEGFGLTPLEAMACGTPVIASRASSMPEVVGDAGILVDPENPEEIAEAMLRVIKNPELRMELSREALKRANTFSWSKAASETVEVLLSVAKR